MNERILLELLRLMGKHGPSGEVEEPEMQPSHGPTGLSSPENPVYSPVAESRGVGGDAGSISAGDVAGLHQNALGGGGLSPTGTGASDRASFMYQMDLKREEMARQRMAAARRMIDVGHQTGNQQLIEQGQARMAGEQHDQALGLERDKLAADTKIQGKKADADLLYGEAQMKRAEGEVAAGERGAEYDPIRIKLDLVRSLLDPMTASSLGIGEEGGPSRGEIMRQILAMEDGDISKLMESLSGAKVQRGEGGGDVANLDALLRG